MVKFFFDDRGDGRAGERKGVRQLDGLALRRGAGVFGGDVQHELASWFVPASRWKERERVGL